MKLIDYKIKYDLSFSELGKLIGVPKGMVHHWTSGRSKPSPRYAMKILRATNQEVTLEDLGMI